MPGSQHSSSKSQPGPEPRQAPRLQVPSVQSTKLPQKLPSVSREQLPDSVDVDEPQVPDEQERVVLERVRVPVSSQIDE